MKLHLLVGLALASFLALSLRASDPQQESIKLAQEWAFALAASVKAQTDAGAKDPVAIRKKATEDTQPQEKKLRAAGKEAGFSAKQIEQGIRDDRKTYLDDFIGSALKAKP